MRELDVKNMIKEGKYENIQAYLKFLTPLEVVDLLYILDEKYFHKIIKTLDPLFLAKALPLLDRTIFEKVISYFNLEELINIFNELETDDAASLLRFCDEEKKESIIYSLEKAKQINQILSYPRGSAGSIMRTEVCILEKGLSIKDAIESIREQKPFLGEVVNAYVVDKKKLLAAIVHLDDLLLGEFDESLDSISEVVVHSIKPEEDQEVAGHLFTNYNLNYLPVIDYFGKILGEITFDDIQDVIEEETREDLLSFAGVNPEESISDNLAQNKIRVALGRLPWIIFSISVSF